MFPGRHCYHKTTVHRCEKRFAHFQCSGGRLKGVCSWNLSRRVCRSLLPTFKYALNSLALEPIERLNGTFCCSERRAVFYLFVSDGRTRIRRRPGVCLLANYIRRRRARPTPSCMKWGGISFDNRKK